MAIAATTAAIIGLSALAAKGAIKQRGVGKATKQQTDAAGQAIVTSDAGVHEANALIENAAKTSGEGVVNTADEAATGLTESAARAGEGLTGAASTAGSNLRGAAVDANSLLAPYMKGGEAGMESLLALLQGPGSQFNFDPNEDPGAKYRMEQAMKAVQKSAALRGGLTSGATLKSLQTRGSDLGAQEFQAAFERFNKSRETTGRLATSAAGIGQEAATRAGGNTMLASERSGIWDTDAARQAGAWNTNAAHEAGNFRTRGSEFAGQMNFNQALQRGNNTIRGSQYAANTLQGIGDVRSAGTMANANSWGDTIVQGSNLVNSAWYKPKPRGGPYGGMPDDNGNYG